jgi:peroxin-2
MDLFSEMGIMLNAKSYGMDLMNLIYSNGFKSTDFRHSPTIYQRVCHLIITVFGKLAWQSFNRIMSKNNWAEKLDYRKIIYIFVQRVELFLNSLSLLNFLKFLHDGVYSTLLDRLLGMRLVYEHQSMTRTMNFEL